MRILITCHFVRRGWRRHHELRRALSRRYSRPVASQDWFLDNLQSAVKEIPKEKLICAIGNYGYDWVEKPKKGKLPPGEADKSVSVQEAWIGSRDSEEEVDYDGDELNPHFSYQDDDSFRHDVWFLDAVTALNEMRAAKPRHPDFRIVATGAEDRSLCVSGTCPAKPMRRIG